MASMFPSGPSTYDELYTSLDTDLRAMADDTPDMIANIIAHVRFGVEAVSAWSGVEMPQEMWRQLHIGVAPYLDGTQFRDATQQPLCVFTKQCEKEPWLRDGLIESARQQPHVSGCVFGTVESRLSKEKDAVIDDSIGAPLPASATPEQKKARAKQYEELQSMCINEANALFPRDNSSHCFCHGRQCNTKCYPRIAPGTFQHPKRLMVSHASPECVGFLRGLGTGLGAAHKSMKAHVLWQVEEHKETKDMIRDMSFSENSGNWKAEVLVRPNQQHQRVIIVRICPSFQARSFSRRRTLVAGLSKFRIIWEGPTNDAEVQRDFAQFVGRSLVVDGRVYMQASEEERTSEFRKLFSSRGMKLPENHSFKWTIEDIEQFASPGLRLRLDDYVGEWRASDPAPNVPTFLDLDHWLESQCGSMQDLFPHQLTHGTNLELVKDADGKEHARIATAGEHLTAQGYIIYPLHDSLNAERWTVSPLLQIMNKLNWSRRQRIHASGNGICIPSYLAFVLYILSRSKRRPDPTIDRLVDGTASDSDNEDGDQVSPTKSQGAMACESADCIPQLHDDDFY